MAADPGKFPGKGAAGAKGLVWGEGTVCPTAFSVVPQLYQIELVIPFVTSNSNETTDIYCPYIWFSRLVFLLPPTLSDTVGGPGGIRASDLKAPSLNCLVVHPLDPPKSKIRNPKSKIPQSKIQNPNFFDRILGILEFGFWIVM